MEPTAAPPQTKTSGKGRSGSRTNPELYEDVPGHVIPILAPEFDDFDTKVDQFIEREMPEEQFIGFRLKQGVYGQRQPDVQMIRVKLPFGGVTPEQMEAFAEIAERFAPLGKGHITTRQNFQFHHIPLPDAAKAIRLMSKAGLSTREACGNTVRNVSGDPWAGVTEDEIFDPTPYAGAFVRYFVRNEVCQLLPRKFKVAFTATDDDRAVTGIHDLGFIPRERQTNGAVEHGFEIRTGGGTSIMPRVAYTLYEFVPFGDYLKVTEAILRIFNRQEELRANRARARIKFLIDRIGIDEFRGLVDEELKGDWVAERDHDPTPLLFEQDEEALAPSPPSSFSSPNGDRSEFDQWLSSSVRPQRQEGFSTAEVRVIRGDLSPEQFRGLAAIMRDFTGGFARTSIQQNLVLRWIRNDSLYDVWTRLRELDLGTAGAHEITDVVSCPGTDSCKLGITSSMGLNTAVRERLEEMRIDDPLTKRIHVKMSGCPNGCSQHHIASIGFYGASIKVGDRHLPAYIAHIGGRYEGGSVQLAKRLKVRLPAKRVPEAIERWIRFYEESRNDGESFDDFVERTEEKEFEGLVKDLTLPVEFGVENLAHFIDWERKEPYKVERGEGECAV
jgi:sulfite reductase beta subunit-like hemoprotein